MSTETMPNTQISVRLDVELKGQADNILAQLGLSTSDFTRMALHQLVLRQGLPFEVNIPNAETQAAMDEPREAMLTFTDEAAMMAYLDKMPNDAD